MKSTSFSRGLELAKLVTQVGLKELRSGDLQSRYDQAMLIVKSLSQLKGAAMKVGQLLSLDLDTYFPPEAIEVLSQLQNSATAHSYEEIEKILKKNLSRSQLGLITSISQKPLGVASIGQVHKAQYKDRDIVLKVQYEGLDQSVDSDLRILKTLAVSFGHVTGRRMDFELLFKEFKDILEQELDYSKEAKFQSEFKKKIVNLNSRSKIQYVVPSVIEELSNKKVIAMDFVQGQSLRSWIQSAPSRQAREEVGRGILDLYLHEFFEWGMVQTDPNLGNFLIQETSSTPRICLLDFGATRNYSSEFIQNYISLLESVANNRKEELRIYAIKFGLIDSRESESAFSCLEEMMKIAIKPFVSAEMKVFDFSNQNHLTESQNAARALVKELKFSPPPYQIFFLHRKLAGVYSILKSLDLQIDISTYWQLMRELSRKSGFDSSNS